MQDKLLKIVQRN